MDAPFLLRPGDHVRVDRGGLYFHHGILVPAAASWSVTPSLARRICDEFTGRDRVDIAALLAFQRHGLDADVVHYVKDAGGGKGRLARTGLAEFVGESDCFELVLPDEGVLHPAETVHRALAHVGRREYFLLDSNCEHFSSWCSTGHWRSSQVEEISTTATVASFLVGLFMPIARPATVVLSALSGHLSEDRPKIGACSRCARPHKWTQKAVGDEIDLSVLSYRHELAATDSDALGRVEWLERLERAAELLDWVPADLMWRLDAGINYDDWETSDLRLLHPPVPVLTGR